MPRYRHHLSMRPSNSQTARLASTGLVHAPCGSVPARVQSRASVVDTPSEYPVLVLRQIPLHALDRAELSARLGDPDRLVFLIGPSPNDDLPKPQAAALHPCQCGVRMHQQGDTLRAEKIGGSASFFGGGIARGKGSAACPFSPGFPDPAG